MSHTKCRRHLGYGPIAYWQGSRERGLPVTIKQAPGRGGPQAGVQTTFPTQPPLNPALIDMPAHCKPSDLKRLSGGSHPLASNSGG